MTNAEHVRLLLFIARDTPRSMLALANLSHALDAYAGREFALEIINVYDEPERALADRVLVTPTLLAPTSARRLIGDLSDGGHLQYFLQSLALPAA